MAVFDEMQHTFACRNKGTLDSDMAKKYSAFFARNNSINNAMVGGIRKIDSHISVRFR